MDSEIEILQRRIEQLERKVEIYYQLLMIDNELDFVMRGGYIPDDDIEDIMDGNY